MEKSNPVEQEKFSDLPESGVSERNGNGGAPVSDAEGTVVDLSRNQSRKSAKRPRGDDWHADTRDASTLYNAAWEAYYRKEVVPEEEWEAFLNSMRTGLPMSVRINVSKGYAQTSLGLAHYLQHQLSNCLEVRTIPFFLPSGCAFQCDVSRGNLKRNSNFKVIKKAIAALNEGGYLTRQETVSMLPPLLLQVEPGQRVLDMCAAPGSKTSQILERLVSNASPSSSSDCPPGVVVANDINFSRIDVLHHQTNRCAGAHPHLIVTNYDATRFPLLPPGDRFDRVLCDVMCSGDGTLRKSVDLWPRWNTLLGADLHAAQCRVLRRGMALCKQGGIVVYSTCSLNPVEDEAVVSACLSAVQQDGGDFELMDPESCLPDLRASEGLTSWSLKSKDLQKTLRTFEEAQAYTSTLTGKGKKFQFQSSMFADPERLRKQNIHFARRIFPHQQDTGGFFVAAMRCKTEVPWNEKKHGTPENVVAALGMCPLQPPNDTLLSAIQKALQLPNDFPNECLVARNETKREQKVYYAHPSTISLSQRLGSRVVSVGGKIFEAVFKYSLDKFRFAPEGITCLRNLLPSSFFVSVPPEVILGFADKDANLSEPEFVSLLEKSGIKLYNTLPPCFILQCSLPVLPMLRSASEEVENNPMKEKLPVAQLGDVLVGVERMTNSRLIGKPQEWQLTLCRLSLGLPVVQQEPTEAKNEVSSA